MGYRLKDLYEWYEDSANNRSIVEAISTGKRFIFNNDGSLRLPDGGLDLGGNALTNVDWANSDAGSGSGLDADTLDGSEPSALNVNDADTVDGKHASDLGGSLTITSPSNVAGSRSLDTQYTNNTGNPLLVNVGVKLSMNAGEYARIEPEVDGTQVGYQGAYPNDADTHYAGVNFIVPDGSSYNVPLTLGGGSTSIRLWSEQELSI